MVACEMKHRIRYACLLLALFLGARSGLCQQLTVQASSGKQVILSRADLQSLPPLTVTAGDVTYQGASLNSVLEKAGVTFGDSLRGKRLASFLLVEAADGYRVVIALPELDPAFTSKQIILAYLRNGQPLDAKEGPYRIVIPDEKRMARWVRQVTTLKVMDAP